MPEILTARVDNKGRLLLPKKVRERLDVKAGDMLFLRLRGKVLQLAKPENPFDVLARQAIRERTAGGTRDIRDVAADWGVKLEHE